MPRHKLTIRNKQPDTPLRGMSTEVLLDGIPLTGAYEVSFKVSGRRSARVIIKLFAEVALDSDVKARVFNEQVPRWTAEEIAEIDKEAEELTWLLDPDKR